MLNGSKIERFKKMVLTLAIVQFSSIILLMLFCIYLFLLPY